MVTNPLVLVSRFNEKFFIVGITLLLLCSMLLLIIVLSIVSLDADKVAYGVCLFGTLACMWIFWSYKKVKGTIFDPYGIFIISAVLFNAGQIILETFCLNVGNGILNGKFTSETIVFTVIFVNICLLAFHLGAIFGSSTSDNNNFAREKVVSPMAVTTVGYILLSVSIVPTIILVIDAINAVAAMGYFALYERQAAVGFGATSNILASFLIPSALFLLAGSNGKRKQLIVSVILIFCYSLIQFFLGFRGWATMPIIAFSWLWHSLVFPLPKKVILISAALLVVFVFPLVGGLRTLNVAERQSVGFADSLIGSGAPIVSTMSEMGGSMQTVAYSLELIPDKRGFDWGEGYLYALLTAVPNFWGELHPTVARGLPSRWLTETVEPIIAKSGGGLGFSFIAEAYLNFGWFGGPFFLCILGYLYSRFIGWGMCTGDVARYAMIACFISFFLYYARGEMSGVVRQLLWYSLIPYLLAYYINKFKFGISYDNYRYK